MPPVEFLMHVTLTAFKKIESWQSLKNVKCDESKNVKCFMFLESNMVWDGNCLLVS